LDEIKSKQMEFDMGEFDGKVIIVTGAAAGIGREAALSFAAKGGAVTIADVNEAGLEEVQQQIISNGGQALVVKTDVAYAWMHVKRWLTRPLNALANSM
jgi:NAD(P)-dependent dehydrogenase (short-subunit alcohol dehydrogenase family)